MTRNRSALHRITLVSLIFATLTLPPMINAARADLGEVKQRGVLRHLGVPYANFVTGSGDGLDVELIKAFAAHLGVTYEYVASSWDDIISDLCGRKVNAPGGRIEILGEWPIKGDLIANGLTVIPWREKIIGFSTPTFPTQVWFIARADSPLKPIRPSGDIDKDIAAVKQLAVKHEVLSKRGGCLDPSLYRLEESGLVVKLFPGELNEMAAAVITGLAETTILDVPDILIALGKWPTKIKVIGPISGKQQMAVAFPKNSPQLREAFNRFFEQSKRDGSYFRLLKKYFPLALEYFPEFFQDISE